MSFVYGIWFFFLAYVTFLQPCWKDEVTIQTKDQSVLLSIKANNILLAANSHRAELRNGRKSSTS